MAKGKGLMALLGDDEESEEPKKGKGLALILGDSDDEDSDLGPDKMSLAKDVKSALKSGDDEAFAEALEAFVYACSSGSMGDDYEDEDY